MSSTTPSPPISTTLHSGTLTSWLPLTTPWPSLSECSSQIWTWAETMMVFDPTFRTAQDNTDLYCQPPEATQSWTQSHQTPQLTTTSLEGLACPEMYTTAWSTSLNSASQYIACCPKSFTPVKSDPHKIATDTEFCISHVTKGQKMSLYANASSGTDTYFVHTTTTFLKDDIISAPQINGYAFLTSSAPQTTATSGTGTGTGIGTGTGLSTTSFTAATGGNSGGGLTTGVKAGIGAGVGVGALGVMALAGAFFVMRRNRRKLNLKGADSGEEQVGGDQMTPAQQQGGITKSAPPDGAEGPYYISVKTELPADDAGVVREQEPVYEMAEDRGVGLSVRV